MEQNNNIACIFVVEVQCRKATHKNGKCILTEEHTNSRMFTDYSTARECALGMWEYYKRLEIDSRDAHITKSGKEVVSYCTTDIWVSRYEVNDGEFLYRAMLGHLTSSDCRNKEPIFSHIL